MTIFSSTLDVLFLGILLGAFLYFLYTRISDFLDIQKNYRKPLEALDSRDLSIFKFLYRQGNYAVLSYDEKNTIYLDLNNQTVTVYKNDVFYFGTHHTLTTEFTIFYNKLVHRFQKEIYIDIVKINNIEYSKNSFSEEMLDYLKSVNYEINFFNEVPQSFKEETKNFLNIDSILDKINRSGIESLTEKEKEFLKKNSGEENEDK
jgi:hypothetical protein